MHLRLAGKPGAMLHLTLTVHAHIAETQMLVTPRITEMALSAILVCLTYSRFG